jgi:hypothetical protein
VWNRNRKPTEPEPLPTNTTDHDPDALRAAKAAELAELRAEHEQRGREEFRQLQAARLAEAEARAALERAERARLELERTTATAAQRRGHAIGRLELELRADARERCAALRSFAEWLSEMEAEAGRLQFTERHQRLQAVVEMSNRAEVNAAIGAIGEARRELEERVALLPTLAEVEAARLPLRDRVAAAVAAIPRELPHPYSEEVDAAFARQDAEQVKALDARSTDELKLKRAERELAEAVRRGRRDPRKEAEAARIAKLDRRAAKLAARLKASQPPEPPPGGYAA